MTVFKSFYARPALEKIDFFFFSFVTGLKLQVLPGLVNFLSYMKFCCGYADTAAFTQRKKTKKTCYFNFAPALKTFIVNLHLLYLIRNRINTIKAMLQSTKFFYAHIN